MFFFLLEYHLISLNGYFAVISFIFLSSIINSFCLRSPYISYIKLCLKLIPVWIVCVRLLFFKLSDYINDMCATKIKFLGLWKILDYKDKKLQPSDFTCTFFDRLKFNGNNDKYKNTHLKWDWFLYYYQISLKTDWAFHYLRTRLILGPISSLSDICMLKTGWLILYYFVELKKFCHNDTCVILA